jgi:hypothetical protein
MSDSMNLVNDLVISVKITEAVTKGEGLILDVSNNWPYVLVSTGAAVHVLAIALEDGDGSSVATTIKALARGPVVIAKGTVTEGSKISPTTSGDFIDSATAAYACGVALEAATAAEFRAMFFTPSDKQQA